jgi:hypothetical protein
MAKSTHVSVPRPALVRLLETIVRLNPLLEHVPDGDREDIQRQIIAVLLEIMGTMKESDDAQLSAQL